MPNADQRRKLMASAYVDKNHRDKWEFIEKRLGRAMTREELRNYIGYVNAKGQFRAPKENWYAVPPGVGLSEAEGDTIPPRDLEKLLQLRISCKMGKRLLADEQIFCEKMLHLFPSAYPKDADVFRITEKMMNPLAGD